MAITSTDFALDAFGPLDLDRRERLLFELLLFRRGRFVSALEILYTVVGIFDDCGAEIVTDTVASLRRKLARCGNLDIAENEAQTSFMLN